MFCPLDECVCTGKQWMREWQDRGGLDDPEYAALTIGLCGTIQTIKDGIATNDLSRAKEAWRELENWQRVALWRAPSKGGVFTTHERKVMLSREWRDCD